MNNVNIVNALASEMGAVVLSIAISFISLHIAFIVLAISIFFTMFMLKEWLKQSIEDNDNTRRWINKHNQITEAQCELNMKLAKEYKGLNDFAVDIFHDVDAIKTLITQRKDMVDLNNRKN